MRTLRSAPNTSTKPNASSVTKIKRKSRKTRRGSENEFKRRNFGLFQQKQTRQRFGHQLEYMRQVMKEFDCESNERMCPQGQTKIVPAGSAGSILQANVFRSQRASILPFRPDCTAINLQVTFVRPDELPPQGGVRCGGPDTKGCRHKLPTGRVQPFRWPNPLPQPVR